MSETAQARRNAPRQKARLARHIEQTLNRARRRAAGELADRYARRPQPYQPPEDDTGRYRP